MAGKVAREGCGSEGGEFRSTNEGNKVLVQMPAVATEEVILIAEDCSLVCLRWNMAMCGARCLSDISVEMVSRPP